MKGGGGSDHFKSNLDEVEFSSFLSTMTPTNSLESEIKEARKQVISDGYEMSFGEILSLYKSGDIKINPEFQRLFRWDLTRKTRFIESILLGIPIPPIFVYQDKQGMWELIDGLQRLSTFFEFVGELRESDGSIRVPSVLEGTVFLPSLAGKKWAVDVEANGIGEIQQRQIKRARIRVEILKEEINPQVKFELFQRLNTGGAQLSEQEVRNCVAVMINPTFNSWITKCADMSEFIETTAQTESAAKKQMVTELALRFFSFRNVPYTSGLNVHEYLDDALLKLANLNGNFLSKEEVIFNRTFRVLHEALGDKAFKKWNGHEFTGKFLMSLFEVVATGVAKNIDEIEDLGSEEAKNFVIRQCKELWSNPVFQRNSGAGVRGTSRLTNLLPIAEKLFKP